MELRRRLVQLLATKKLRPSSVVDYRRFDLPAKTIYGRAYLAGNTAKWPEEVYRQHLKVWNGFSERKPKKTSYQEYKKAFESLLDAMKTDYGFAYKEHPVPVTRQGQLFDGAHRVASALLNNRDLYAVKTKVAIQPYDYLFFKNRTENVAEGLAEKYLDAMAIEYLAIQKTKPYVVIFFPKANDKIEESERRLQKYGSVVYAKKSISITEAGRYNLIRQLYDGEPWNREDNPGSIRHKAEGCFETAGDIRVYLLETTKTHQQIVRLKTELRDMYGHGKHSVHMTDTHREAEVAARMFFNENSLHLINNAKDWVLPKKLGEMFAEYRQMAPPNENRCIDSSAVMALYGLRDANDIDYLHIGEKSKLDDIPGRISDHNPHAGFYADSIADIVTDPSKHLYYCGYKFASLDVVEKMKKNRGEDKDKVDIRLIKTIGNR